MPKYLRPEDDGKIRHIDNPPKLPPSKPRAEQAGSLGATGQNVSVPGRKPRGGRPRPKV